MLIKVILNLTGFFIFMYILWLRLKDDYIANQIFNCGFIVVASLILGNILAVKYFQQWWFWSGFIFGGLGIFISIYFQKLRVIETIDANIAGILPWLLLVFLQDFFLNKSLTSLIISLFLLLIIGLYYFLDKKYKNFAWYKSGSVGFSSLSILGLIFTVRSVLALFNISMLSFIPKYDIYLSVTVAFIAFLSLYGLARIKS